MGGPYDGPCFSFPESMPRICLETFLVPKGFLKGCQVNFVPSFRVVFVEFLFLTGEVSEARGYDSARMSKIP